MAKITIPYTTFVNPQNIEVQRGQLFYVRVFGLGGSGNYSSVEYVDFLNRWTFTPNSNQIELVKREDLGTIESGAWFRAGNIPGDYTISITSRDSEEFGESFCYVRIVESAITGDIEQISPSLYSVDFLDEDNPANINYSSNPQKFYWFEQKFGESHNSRISNPASKIGWRYPSNSVFSITSDNNYFYFHRGNYGIVLAQAYLKSNPYIYYPVRIMYNGGDVKYYVPSSSSNTIRAVELTKSTVVLERNSVVQIRANVIDTLGTDSAGVSWAANNGGIVIIVAIRATSNPTSTVLSIRGYRVGATTVTIRSNTDPSKYAILSVNVVASEEDVYTPVLYVTSSETSVTLPPSSTFTLVGQAVKDLPEAYPSRLSGYVGFESSDSSIANITRVYTNTSTLNRADIATGTKQGTATIIVYSKDDPSKTATCIVNVRSSSLPDDPDGTSVVNPVSSVSINESDVKIAEGGFSQLSVTVVGQYTNQSSVNTGVIWSSSNDGVVSVDKNGRIFGLKVGTATIVAVSAENRNIYGTCVVTVREREDSDGPIVLPDDKATNVVDTILRVDYNDDGSFKLVKLFEGDLNFDSKHPIESVVYHETDDIQKIYWVDGKNVLRFMNFMAEPDSLGHYPWQNADGSYDNTYFDSNREIDFGAEVQISKESSGNQRANGVVQYLLTYYNKHGQETGAAWISDLVYLTPVDRGGAADETNSNSIILSITGLDTKFTNFRIYSVFRSSYDGQPVGSIVYDGITTKSTVTVVDDGAHLINVDASRLLFLGSEPVRVGTMAHKDQTLFLGDLQSIGKDGYDKLEEDIRKYMFKANGDGLSSAIRFVYTTNDSTPADYPIGVESAAPYSYESQMKLTSSSITTFKGGEKYRFALSFCRKDGSMTEAFWIGDAVNSLYPKIEGKRIHRVAVQCNIPKEVVSRIIDCEFKSVRLMIAEATYADRSVKAQGIVNPTVFNVWERYNDRLYGMASWITRPRGSGFTWRHFEPIKNSTSSLGEIQCNYWETESAPTPYYQLNDYDTSPTYTDEFDGMPDYDYYKIVYAGQFVGSIWLFTPYFVTAKLLQYTDDARRALHNLNFNSIPFNREEWTIVGDEYHYEYSDDNGYYTVNLYITTKVQPVPTEEPAVLRSYLHDNHDVPYDIIVDSRTLRDWSERTGAKSASYFSTLFGGMTFPTAESALTWNGSTLLGGWFPVDEQSGYGSSDYRPSYYRKHLSFVDENLITLNSPEFEYEAVNVDNADYKFRIVGVARIDGGYSDYTVDATQSRVVGESLVSAMFPTKSDGLLSWPLWKEKALREKTEDDESDFEHSTDDKKDWTSDDYILVDSLTRQYWLHMWNHSGKITSYYNKDKNDATASSEDNYSILNHKTFANLRYSNLTVYNNLGGGQLNYSTESIRMFNFLSSQYTGVSVGGKMKYYDGNVNIGLSVPGGHKYPVLYSVGNPDTSESIETNSAYLYIKEPVQISFASNPHAVITLPTKDGSIYNQTILPRLPFEDPLRYPLHVGPMTGLLLPWIENTASGSYPYKDYAVSQGVFSLDNGTLDSSDKYVYIGEIYQDYSAKDTRYGGTTESAVKNNRFIIAGPQYLVSDMVEGSSHTIYGDQGDTYFQRWDCLKTKPYSTGAVNNVIDITSVMLETHINIDGRTDRQRGSRLIASIDYTNFGSLNRVYSQPNNFFTRRDLDSDNNLDAYRSSLTWTLQKSDAADIDEWTHVTLTSNLKLDGDKGICQAIRRFNNSLIAFQDRGISEILFNSRTQLSTQDGVPVEIANSGKVDGKRYITNKYGCTNKWSIVEGKSALYFVDNINKAFCGFNGSSMDNISSRLGFSVWFRNINDTSSWKPVAFNNLVAYYDRIHSDVYLVRAGDEDNDGCLVYNESVGAFTSFFDYYRVPMMVNVEDRFVSYRNHALWLQNEGFFCNFFGEQYDAWAEYRVTPEPYSDKVWTNLEYRTDFYRILDSDGNAVAPEEEFTSDRYYLPNVTYDYMRFWNEYQTTADEAHYNFKPEKKFRLWRLQIPRAIKEGRNKFGLDRIRNPWMNLIFKKRYDSTNNTDLMQIHDITAIYYE